MTEPVLFIGGMDSSAGAGILRDCETARILGTDMRIAVTAVTAQSDHDVSAIHPVPANDVVAQIRTAGQVGAVKIGMLATARIAQAVSRSLPLVPLVLDPVLAASSGRPLLDEDGVGVMLASLLPQITVLTPNLPELYELARRLGVSGNADEHACVSALMRQGCPAILVKGGHAVSGPECEDRLYLQDGQIIRFSGPRFTGKLRGTGCQLASAIAVDLARGAGLRAAVMMARNAVQDRFHLMHEV
ncbi:MAG: hydroxymethylpyrimidine/phosphomethylpyrimidine kinase [Paracoccus sp. (in: a-proteobacteria)]